MKVSKIRFDEADQYFIDGQPYVFVFDDERFAYFRREYGSGAIEQFSWIELHNLIGGPRWDCIRKTKALDTAKQRPDPYFCIWELPETQQNLLFESVVLCYGTPQASC